MFTWSRRYTGTVRAVLLDWAGTAIDHGCQAQVGLFVELFRRHGVTVTPMQAREPMGLHKREHIRAMCEAPAIRRAWILRNGAPPSEDDIATMYAMANDLHVANLQEHATPIPGMVALLERLRDRGIRVGSTSDYDRKMLEVVAKAAARHGYAPEVAVSSSDVEAARPAPWMCHRAAEVLGVYPSAACVAVGDTPLDIEAGLNAGMWTVGVACTGNLIGMTAQEWATLPGEQKIARRDRATRALREAGAHYVIDAAVYLLPVIDKIEGRLRAGEVP